MNLGIEFSKSLVLILFNSCPALPIAEAAAKSAISDAFFLALSDKYRHAISADSVISPDPESNSFAFIHERGGDLFFFALCSGSDLSSCFASAAA